MNRGGEDHRTRSALAEEPGPYEQPSAADVWARVKRRLRAELGEDVFASWFGRLELETVVDGVALLTVPTRFLKSWIEAHYVDRVLSVYRCEAPAVERVTIGVRSTLGREAALLRGRAGEAPRPVASVAPAPPLGLETKAAPALADERSDASDLSGAPLDLRFTFDSFVVGRSNALAHAAADRVARHINGQALYNPLYLHAGVGLGKTHLLHAIGHEARTQGRRVIYLTADRFMYGFVASLKAQTSLAFKERLRGIDLLVIDDVQFIQGKQIQQEFGHTLNSLIDSGRQIVVAADRPPADLESLDERVRSRLAGGLVVEVGCPRRGVARLDPEQPHRRAEGAASDLRRRTGGDRLRGARRSPRTGAISKAPSTVSSRTRR